MRSGPFLRLAGRVASLVLLIVALAVFLAQIEVRAADSDVSRTCGSAFDVSVDRTGWQEWWAADLSDAATHAELTRTVECPDAVNARVAASAVLAALGAGGLVLSSTFGATRARRSTRSGEKLAVLGRITFIAGIVLTIAGCAAIVVLVADADSTLFLYTDRLVVSVVGLIVLVPAIALIVLGRALTIISPTVDTSEDEHEHV